MEKREGMGRREKRRGWERVGGEEEGGEGKGHRMRGEDRAREECGYV